MGGWVDRIGEALLDASLATTVVTGLVALAMVGCRQPARRCVLARAALLGALAIWPLVVLAPLDRIEVVRPARWFLPPKNQAALGSTPHAVPDTTTTIQTTAKWPPLRLHRWAARGLTLLALSGTILGLAWLGLGWWGTGWLSRRSAPAGEAAQALYDSLRPPFARRPALRVAARLSRPVLVGTFRPVILIPADLDQPGSAARLRLSLLHELAHAELDDPAFSMLGNLAQAIWFFLPTVWWIRGQMYLDQEFLADHHASHGFAHSTAYASSLVSIAAPAAQGASPSNRVSVPATRPTAAGAGSALFLRVLMLVRCPFPVEAAPPSWWRWAVAPIVGCVTLVASALSLRTPEPETAPPTAQAAGTVHGAFHLVRLITEAEKDDSDSAVSKPYVLPPLLPPSFDLSLEVWASAADLPEVRIVGYHLLPISKVTDGWHAIHVHRERGLTTFTLDGRSVSAVADSGPPSKRLTVAAAPHQPGLFRNLVMRW